MLSNKYKYILIFDFETTGLDPYHDKIVEIGAILLEKKTDNQFGIVKELNVLIKQDLPLPDKIVEITGITDELLFAEGITEKEAFMKFQELYTNDCLLVAYNIAFDYGFLNELYRKYLGVGSYYIKNDLLDVMAIYKDRYRYPHRLESAAETYGIINEDAHRALDDAKTTLKVLVEMIKERDNKKYINVIGYNPKYRAININPACEYITRNISNKKTHLTDDLNYKEFTSLASCDFLFAT